MHEPSEIPALGLQYVLENRLVLLFAKVSSNYLGAYLDEIGADNFVAFSTLLELIFIYLPASPVTAEPLS